MRRITVEADLGTELGEVHDQVVLCDAEGHALGFFSPLIDKPLVEELQLEPPRSISQTADLRKVQTGKPLNEILGRLGL